MRNTFSKKKKISPPHRKFEGALFNINFFNVENSIKREMRKNTFSKKKMSTPPPPPPRKFFFLHQFFFG